MRKRSLSRVTLKRIILEEMMRINEVVEDFKELPGGKKFSARLVPQPGIPEEEGFDPIDVEGDIVQHQGTPRYKLRDVPFGYGKGDNDKKKGLRGVNIRLRKAIQDALGLSKSPESSSPTTSKRITKLQKLENALMLVADYLVGVEAEDALIELIGTIEDLNLGIGDIQDANPYNVDSDLPEMDALEYDDLADLYDDYEDDLGDVDDEDPFAKD
jgi:hypothetical protein